MPYSAVPPGWHADLNRTIGDAVNDGGHSLGIYLERSLGVACGDAAG